jgi:hypothetical protein
VLVLKNYDATNGDAFRIIVNDVDNVQILDPSNVDETSRLVAAKILVEPTTDAVEAFFGSDWADVARVALEIKTNPTTTL